MYSFRFVFFFLVLICSWVSVDAQMDVGVEPLNTSLGTIELTQLASSQDCQVAPQVHLSKIDQSASFSPNTGCNLLAGGPQSRDPSFLG